LREAEQERDRISWLFDIVPIGYVLLDDNGSVKDTSRSLEKLLGFKPGMLLTGPLVRLLVKADVPAFLNHLRQCKLAACAVTTEIRLRNGKIGGMPVEITSLPQADPQTRPGLYRTAIIDLTNRRAAEQKLTGTVQRFETLLDTVEGVVWEADGNT